MEKHNFKEDTLLSSLKDNDFTLTNENDPSTENQRVSTLHETVMRKYPRKATLSFTMDVRNTKKQGIIDYLKTCCGGSTIIEAPKSNSQR